GSYWQMEPKLDQLAHPSTERLPVKKNDLQALRRWAIQDSNLGPLPYQAAPEMAGYRANPAWILRLRPRGRCDPSGRIRADYGRLRAVVAGLPITTASPWPPRLARAQRPRRPPPTHPPAPRPSS